MSQSKQLRKSAPKRKCTFTPELKSDFPFLDKITEDRVRCRHCNSEFSVAHGGRSDIKDHIQTQKHTSSLSRSARLDTFFKKSTPQQEDLALAAKEATFAYHHAIHNISFKTADCSSKLISKLFEAKFSSAKTKTEAIILKAIVPLAEEDLKRALMECHFIAVTVDASNRKDVKVLPVMVRHFLPERGVQVKLLDFHTVPGETARIITDSLLATLTKHNVRDKVVAFCGDNCNTNFGGVRRHGQNNVLFHLKKELGRNIAGVGCGAHIVHNCLQAAVDELPLDVELLVVKIYKYFHIYTVRVTQLKEFCEFTEVEFQKVLNHGNTRFLSLLPAIDRILRILPALKAFFDSQPQCPKVIRDFCNSKTGELYLTFVHGQLTTFNDITLSMKRTNASATDVVHELNILKSNLQRRLETIFIPLAAEILLRKLVADGECNENEVKREFSAFYNRALVYISDWEGSFGGGENFLWITEPDFTFADFQAAANNINENVGKTVIITDQLFNEVDHAACYWKTRVAAWAEFKTSFEDKWVQVFSHLKLRHVPVPNLRKVVEYILCLPGTSAPAERTFSIMNYMWSQERGLMKQATIHGLFTCKLNIALNCTEFYEKIKGHKKFLEKVHSSEKYSRDAAEASTSQQ